MNVQSLGHCAATARRRRLAAAARQGPGRALAPLTVTHQGFKFKPKNCISKGLINRYVVGHGNMRNMR